LSLQLSELWIYPLKSAQGIALPVAELSPTGLLHDRRWLLVDPAGRFVSQRECPALARLQLSLSETELGFELGAASLKLPLPPYDLPEIPVQVWRSRVLAQCFAEPVNRWFSQHLQRPLQLVYMPEHCWRATNPDFAPGRQVSFADGYPYLLTHSASLADLNARLQQAVPMNRFRPNLVIAGGSAYAEDHWRQLRIGGLHFEIVKPCGRCVIVDIDQKTGSQQPEVLQVLASYRRQQDQVIFGQNAVCAQSAGTLQTGLRVEILNSVT